MQGSRSGTRRRSRRDRICELGRVVEKLIGEVENESPADAKLGERLLTGHQCAQ
jgi:hypothetical protein